MNLEKLYDPYRNQWVVATPEEKVRQQWLEVMTEHLSFPKELIVIEKAIERLPHLKKGGALPQRRIDLLAYTKLKEGPLKPLILIECKCIPLTDKALMQVLGYNHFVGASYIAIANQEEIRIGFKDQKTNELTMLDFLPAYPLLNQAMAQKP